jgi:putative spermidine/putrescine transport system ATP-binding protein
MTIDESLARLSIEEITKRYGDLTALEPTSLVVRQGEFVCLLGPSGSGKTTLLNIVAGTTLPTSGRVLLDGRDITRLPSRERQLGMIFQHYALVPHMTVSENVAFPLKVRGVSKNEISKKVQAVLETVRLAHLSDRKPHELSGGQQQRVSIARCLVYDPPVILMDEPLGALDKGLREAMQFEIKRLHTQLGITALYVTHDQDEAMMLSDRICVVSDGKISQVSSARNLYYKPSNEFVAQFLGESNLLPGKVLKSGSRTKVDLAGGLGIIWSGQVTSLAEGTGVLIMIRPESINVSRSRDETRSLNHLQCVVERLEFLGGVTRVRLRATREILLSLKLLSSDELLSSLSVGEKVWASWNPEDTGVFHRSIGA